MEPIWILLTIIPFLVSAQVKNSNPFPTGSQFNNSKCQYDVNSTLIYDNFQNSEEDFIDTVEKEASFFNLKTMVPPIICGAIGGLIGGSIGVLPAYFFIPPEDYTLRPLIGVMGFLGGYTIGTTLPIYILTRRKLNAPNYPYPFIGGCFGVVAGGVCAYGLMFTSFLISEKIYDKNINSALFWTTLVTMGLIPATMSTIACMLSYQTKINSNVATGLKLKITENGVGLAYQF